MKTIQDKVKKYLEIYPQARERKNRAKAVYRILGYVVGYEPVLDLVGFGRHWSTLQSINRQILKVQELYPNLRGTDYEDKERLEQEKQIELGYVPGFNNDIKKLKTL